MGNHRAGWGRGRAGRRQRPVRMEVGSPGCWAQDGDEGTEEWPLGEVAGMVDEDCDAFGVEAVGVPVVEAVWQGIPGPAEVVRDLAALNGVKTCDGSMSLRPSKRMMLPPADCSRCGSTSTSEYSTVLTVSDWSRQSPCESNSVKELSGAGPSWSDDTSETLLSETGDEEAADELGLELSGEPSTVMRPVATAAPADINAAMIVDMAAMTETFTSRGYDGSLVASLVRPGPSTGDVVGVGACSCEASCGTTVGRAVLPTTFAIVTCVAFFRPAWTCVTESLTQSSSSSPSLVLP
jgi:hypothetical protein